MDNFWGQDEIVSTPKRNELSPDERFEHDLSSMNVSNLRALYRSGKIKLSESEKEILQFCHNHDMKEFLREEFTKHPIVLDEDGGLKYGNPFDKERESEPQMLCEGKTKKVTIFSAIGNLFKR